MHNYSFKLYMLTGIRSVVVGECSSGDIAIFAISLEKINFCCFLVSAIAYKI